MKIGILLSGRRSNMVALVDAVVSGEIPRLEVGCGPYQAISLVRKAGEGV